jgi:hypothetical protein
LVAGAGVVGRVSKRPGNPGLAFSLTAHRVLSGGRRGRFWRRLNGACGCVEGTFWPRLRSSGLRLARAEQGTTELDEALGRILQRAKDPILVGLVEREHPRLVREGSFEQCGGRLLHRPNQATRSCRGRLARRRASTGMLASVVHGLLRSVDCSAGSAAVVEPTRVDLSTVAERSRASTSCGESGFDPRGQPGAAAACASCGLVVPLATARFRDALVVVPHLEDRRAGGWDESPGRGMP